MVSNHIAQNSSSLEIQTAVALEAEFLMQKLGPRERQHINSVLNRANLGEWKQNKTKNPENYQIRAKRCGFILVPL